MITLYLQRHGQATHNAAEDHAAQFEISKAPIHSGQEFFDAPLTVTGMEQAKASARPEELADPDLNDFEFWVSPLRRAIQTATLSMPHIKRWRVVELIREISGEKLCDARHTKQEIESWLNRNYPTVECWSLDDLESEEDLYKDRPREGAGEILRRVAGALGLALRSEKKKFVWVSHSAFLSCLFALLDKLAVPERWLENGAWKRLELSEEQIRSSIDGKLSPKPAPFLRPKNDKVANALVPVQHISLPPGVYLYTTEMMASLAFAVQTTARVTTALTYPVQWSGAESLVSSVVEHLEIAKNENDDNETDKDLTKPVAISGSLHIHLAVDNAAIKVARLGFYAGSSIILLCVPRASSATAALEGLPPYVSTDYLRNVLTIAAAVKEALHAPAISVVFPFDL